ncbi:MAG: DegT/DnrJ/EryC1/StrS family aminotransferase [Gemmatimonadota bacterium]|nr:DegT/DnrJ/EryC1/StrS family aminotransferase [Gemmatimonadota bacterium]
MERFGKLELDYLAEVIASGSLNSHTGEFTTRLEERFAAWVGAEYALAMNSAMSVLHTAVAASGVGPGVEVVCDSAVHFGGAAVMYHNGVPVFCDIDEDSWNMDSDSLEACITEHTGAVICTPMWGNPPDYEGILRVADRYGLPVIEDAAHGVGGSYRGRPLGTLGAIGSFSFQEAKHLTSGDGGMAVTDRADMVEKMQEMRIIKTTLGWNYRMTELQAGVMLAQMDRADGIISAHHEAGALYCEAAAETPWLVPQRVADGCVNAYHAVAFRFEGDREGISVERFQETMAEHGCPVSIGYKRRSAAEDPIFTEVLAYGKGCPIRCPHYKGRVRYGKGVTPVADRTVPRMVVMPMDVYTPGKTEEYAERIQAGLSALA